jgi:hypothetical protein
MICRLSLKLNLNKKRNQSNDDVFRMIWLKFVEIVLFAIINAYPTQPQPLLQLQPKQYASHFLEQSPWIAPGEVAGIGSDKKPSWMVLQVLVLPGY